MPRYCVDVYSTVRHRFFVDADTGHEASEKARAEVVNNSDADLAMALKDWDIDETCVKKMED